MVVVAAVPVPPTQKADDAWALAGGTGTPSAPDGAGAAVGAGNADEIAATAATTVTTAIIAVHRLRSGWAPTRRCRPEPVNGATWSSGPAPSGSVIGPLRTRAPAPGHPVPGHRRRHPDRSGRGDGRSAAASTRPRGGGRSRRRARPTRPRP